MIALFAGGPTPAMAGASAACLSPTPPRVLGNAHVCFLDEVRILVRLLGTPPLHRVDEHFSDVARRCDGPT